MDVLLESASSIVVVVSQGSLVCEAGPVAKHPPEGDSGYFLVWIAVFRVDGETGIMFPDGVVKADEALAGHDEEGRRGEAFTEGLGAEKGVRGDPLHFAEVGVTEACGPYDPFTID